MRLRTSVTVLFFLFVCPLATHAGTIVVDDFVGVTVGYFSPLHVGEARAVLGSNLMSNGAGVSPAIDGLVFEAYCVELDGPIFETNTPQPPATFDATAASMSAWNLYVAPPPLAGRQVAWLYEQFAGGIAAANDNVGRTGLLMAIWNQLYDGDLTVDLGPFRVSPADVAVRAAANGYLAALGLNLVAAATADATWLQLQDCSVTPCRNVQDFVGPDSIQPMVAEPSTAALLSLGIGLAARARRQRLKRT